MPGFDRTRFVNVSESGLEELICGICLEVLNNPVYTSCCRQSYCSDCINSWLNQTNTCPNDRQPLTPDQLLDPPRALLNLLDNMEIKCNFFEKGCNDSIRLNEIEIHCNRCKYNPKNVCKYCELPIEGTDHLCLKYINYKIKKIDRELALLLDKDIRNDSMAPMSVVINDFKLLREDLKKIKNEQKMRSNVNWRPIQTENSANNGDDNEETVLLNKSGFIMKQIKCFRHLSTILLILILCLIGFVVIDKLWLHLGYQYMTVVVDNGTVDEINHKYDHLENVVNITNQRTDNQIKHLNDESIELRNLLNITNITVIHEILSFGDKVKLLEIELKQTEELEKKDSKDIYKLNVEQIEMNTTLNKLISNNSNHSKRAQLYQYITIELMVILFIHSIIL